MERERLNHLMQDPSFVAKEDLAGLQELTARYPWFSAAHLLLAVGEHAAGDVLYDERARTAAAHLPSRAVLFDLVHAPPPEPVEPVAAAPVPTAWAMPPVVDVPPVVAAAPEPHPLPIAPAFIPPVEPVVQPAVPAWVQGPEAVTSPADLAEATVGHPPVEVPLPAVAPAPEPPATTVAPSVPPAPEEDPLDALIRRSAFAGSYELLLEHEEAAPPEAPVPAEPGPAPIVAAPPTGRLRFTDWLAQADPLAPTPSTVPARPKPSAPVPEATGSVVPEAPTVLPEAPAKPKAGMSVSEAASLIDRFIRQETPEPPKRAAFFNPQTAAKRSLEDHAELVTETLAQIYAKQGNLAKAKAAYRRLAEKHPERREHFLALAKGLDAAGKA